MKTRLFAALVAVTAAGAVLAHEGVENETVLARMDGMKELGQELKTLGAMAKGQQAFDADAAQAALDRIAEGAAQIAGQFEAEVVVEKSEARPAIWRNWEDFTAKADALAQRSAALRVTRPGDLGPALRDLGGACKACHTDYRE